MNTRPHVLPMLFASLFVAVEGTAQEPEAAYADEVLRIPGLINAIDNTYFTDVELRLGGDGSWQLLEAALADLIYIENLTVNILESYPVQVVIDIDAILPAPCYQHRIHQRRLDRSFHLVMTAIGPDSGIFCAGPTQPFSVSVALDVAGLEAGSYQVRVNDKLVEFALEIDN